MEKKEWQDKLNQLEGKLEELVYEIMDHYGAETEEEAEEMYAMIRADVEGSVSFWIDEHIQEEDEPYKEQTLADIGMREKDFL